MLMSHLKEERWALLAAGATTCLVLSFTAEREGACAYGGRAFFVTLCLERRGTLLLVAATQARAFL